MDLLEMNQDISHTSDARTILAVCCDCHRCGCAVYQDSQILLVADRQDSGDPYKGLDIIIQRFNPKVVIISAAQKKLLRFFEQRFKTKISDLSKKGNNFLESQKKVSTLKPLPLISNLTDAPPIQRSSAYSPSLPQNPFATFTATSQPSVFAPSTPNPSLNDRELSDMNLADNFECPIGLGEEKFTLTIVPNTWFSMGRAMNKLIDCELVQGKNFNCPEQRLMFISTRIKKSIDACAIRSVAAIDRFLELEMIIDPDAAETQPRAILISQGIVDRQQQSQFPSYGAAEGRGNNCHMPILDIKYVDPGPVLSIDKLSIEALGIFDQQKINPEVEPDAMMSLYHVLNRCQSRQGKRHLRTMMVWPLQDIDELRKRHDAIEFFMNVDNRLLRDQITTELKNIVPLSGLLTKLSHSVGTYREMATLYKALWSFTAIVDLLKVHDHAGFEILDRIVQLDSPEFRSTVDSIINVVDFEASRKGGRVEVCFGIDNIVDEKREIVKNLAKFCDEVAIQETAKYRNSVGKVFRVIYVPRIGFLSSVEFTSSSELMQMRANRELDVLLFTEQSIYFKTKRMEELDTNAGDIACDLIDVQEKVLIELQKELLKHTEVMLNFTELCGELDCLIAFATISAERGYTRPEFVSSQEGMDMQNAYHPLKSIRENMVPNEVQFFHEASRRVVKVMVLTGPNSCGKSTYIKTICLIIYMAQIGCYVPATMAKLPIVDAILTRLHTANSISTGLSSFATDLHQVNFALNQATSRSIIAIDEFGEGTQAADGLLLLKGLVIYFAKRAQASPYVVIATHFNRLINHLQSYNGYIIYKTFKVSRDYSKDSIIYEFKVTNGVGEVSLADEVATRAGVPQVIIDRARQIRSMITEGRAITPKPPRGA